MQMPVLTETVTVHRSSQVTVAADTVPELMQAVVAAAVRSANLLLPEAVAAEAPEGPEFRRKVLFHPEVALLRQAETAATVAAVVAVELL